MRNGQAVLKLRDSLFIIVEMGNTHACTSHACFSPKGLSLMNDGVRLKQHFSF
jgi:hypothetical protein